MRSKEDSNLVSGLGKWRRRRREGHNETTIDITETLHGYRLTVQPTGGSHSSAPARVPEGGSTGRQEQCEERGRDQELGATAGERRGEAHQEAFIVADYGDE